MSINGDEKDYISSPFGANSTPPPPKTPVKKNTAKKTTEKTAKPSKPTETKVSAIPKVPTANKATPKSTAKPDTSSKTEVKSGLPKPQAPAKPPVATKDSIVGKTGKSKKTAPKNSKGPAKAKSKMPKGFSKIPLEDKKRKSWDLQEDKINLLVQKKLSKKLLEELVFSLNQHAISKRDEVDAVRKPFVEAEFAKIRKEADKPKKFIPIEPVNKKFKNSEEYLKVKETDEKLKELYDKKEFLLESLLKPAEYSYFNTANGEKGRKQVYFKTYYILGQMYLLPTSGVKAPLNLKEIEVVYTQADGEPTPLPEVEQIFDFIKANLKDIKLS